MARKKVPAEELRRRRRAREIRRKSSSEGKPPEPDGGDKADDVCAICDNGGSLTCCGGVCQRSFHLDDSEGSACRSALGITEQEAKMVTDMEEDFICKNCEYKQHQCFACGLLGSSDLSSRPEVYQCEHDGCGRFYHPKCVAELLYDPGSEEAALFEHQVAAGLGFPCPVHECCDCTCAFAGGEDKDDEDMKLAVCRRCPTAYHRKCLPRGIRFETRRGPNGWMQRAWDGILRDRVLIYCTKHEIVRELGTPKRDHILFPDAWKVGALKAPGDWPMGVGQDMPGEEAEQPCQPCSKPSPSPPLAASDKKQCSCSGPLDSFAPKALFMHPQPGSCGWLDD